MIKGISFIVLVALGIGALFLGTSLAPAFAVPVNIPVNAEAAGGVMWKTQNVPHGELSNVPHGELSNVPHGKCWKPLPWC
jgi:hypothetical protein